MTEHFEPNADELIGYNIDFAEGFADSELQVSPMRNLAVVACMDSRIDTFKILGLGNGEAHIIRNAGGVITDDVIRSLCLSQRLLGTREVLLVHHTDAEREWAYHRESSIGRLDRALDIAGEEGWTVVDMKNDWSRIFP